MARATVQIGQITYHGFNPKNNGKWIIETRNEWTYVQFQENEFTVVIVGYVVEKENGYNAFNFSGTYDEMFDDKSEAIEFVKSKRSEVI